MDNKKLIKILMKWGLENKEYDMVYIIYTNLNIGIPNAFIYQMPKQNCFSTIKSALKNNNIKLDFHTLKKLLTTFLNSKWTQLEEWDNSYGYKFIKTV
jgi:hypothetical protein